MQLNKQDEKLLQELLRKYKQGIVSGLYPGTNITFTSTGCRDKIISSAGGGGGGSSALFPNGTKFISSSRDFQSDDAGYILFLDSNVSMTMPIVNPFSIHDNVGIMSADESSSFNIENGGSPIRFAPNEVEGEVVLLTTELLDGNIYLLPISTSIIDDNGIRKTSIKYLYDKVNASGGASLSGLTAATATNTINNANFGQEWQWNSLAAGTGLKLSSTSTGAASNTQSIFGVYQSGANATSGQTTYGAIFSNIHTGTSSTNIAAKFSASGATNNYAIEADNLIKIVNSSTGVRGLTFWSSSGENARIGCGYNNSGFDNVEINNLATSGNTAVVFKTQNTECARFTGSSGYLHLGTTGNANYPLHINGNAAGFSMYCDNRILCDAGSQYGFTAQNAGGLANFGAVSGSNIAVISTASTPQIYVTSTNTGIGTTSTPDASAKLELSSTTSGFLPPRMTATQASAISSPAKGLMLYVTNTNGTFTSAGWWGYGTSWKLILAE